MVTVQAPDFASLVGGAVCLDFANTVGPRRPSPEDRPTDHIPDVQRLLGWAAHVGLLTGQQSAVLSRSADQDPESAAAVLGDARWLREAIYDAFSAVADGAQAPQVALDAIQSAYLTALSQARLTRVSSGLGWEWPNSDSLEQVLWPIARSAVDLALSDQLARVRRCPGDDGHCGWLFLDLSKSGTRRWCSMRTCGSRVKSRRQVERLRTARASNPH
ncbi:MAG: ABATE domain-containing protein [Microlunatus sp.]